MPTLIKSLDKCTSAELVAEGVALSVMAKRAKTLEAREALTKLAERYRELAARRAALGCLSQDDPATPVLTRMIDQLAREISQR